MTRTYIDCPNCSRHLETRHQASEWLMVYAMDSPQRSCPHCRRVYRTGSTESSEFGKAERGLYLVLQVIYAAFFGAAVGWMFSLVVLACSGIFGFSVDWLWLGAIPGAGVALLYLLLVKLNIKSSAVRSRIYAVRTGEGQILSVASSYYEIMSMVACRHWPLSFQVTTDPQLSKDWIDLQKLLLEGEDIRLCDFTVGAAKGAAR